MTDVGEQLRAAMALHQSGRFADAETIYRQALSANPSSSDALNLLGVLCGQTARTAEAIELLRRAVTIDASNAAAWSNLGEFLRVSGRTTEAVEALERAIALAPNHAAAHNNLANALKKLGKPDEAIAHFRRAIELNPGIADAWSNLSATLLDRAKVEESIEAASRALKINSRLPAAHNNLGNALAHRDVIAAERAYRDALTIDPKLAEAWSNLGALKRSLGQLAEAIDMQRKAIALQPAHVPAYSLLGAALQNAGLIDEAIESYREALSRDPKYREAHQNLLNAMNYHGALPPTQVRDEHLAFESKFADPLRTRWRGHDNDRSSKRPLRIGYLSGDFRAHSVAYFIEPIIEHHDRSRSEVHLYSNTDKPDAVTDRFRAAGVFRDIAGQTDDETAELIRADRIDILIDLSGHTARNRLGVLARKPAPVQATYLGYPNTTGLSAIDWRLTDAWVDPPGEADSLYVERLCRLPRCAWVYRPPESAPLVQERSPDRPFTFGSFNALAKIGPATLDLWASVLQAVPGSRLMVKALALQDEFAQERLSSELAARGVERSRFDLVGEISSFAEHLRAYARIAAALDSFPYHGTTTTCEALWMGVPVVTLAGSVHAARVGVSLLHAVGLDELIASTPQQYVSIAQSLAGDADRVRELRMSMRERLRASPLLDAVGMTRAMEEAYQRMWTEYVAT